MDRLTDHFEFCVVVFTRQYEDEPWTYAGFVSPGEAHDTFWFDELTNYGEGMYVKVFDPHTDTYVTGYVSISATLKIDYD